MPKKLFLAPATSGKTAYTLDLARQTAKSLQAEARVCVPTGLQARAWRRRLSAAGGAIGIHVLTFDQLVAACLNAAGEAYTQLSEPVQFRLLRTIIDQLSLDHYAPLKTKPGFIQVIKQVITELKSALVDPLEFLEATAELGNELRLRELASIYIAYQEQLQKQGWADRVGLHWLAVESLKERAPDACRDWPLLIVEGFSDFTPSQLSLLQLLTDRVDEFIITLPQAERVNFPRYQRTRQAVEKVLDIIGEPLTAVAQPEGHPTLRHLARHMFALSAAEIIPNEGALILREVPDRMAEVRTALRWLKQRIVWEGIPPDQTALLARTITPYRSFIRQIAAELGLPVCLVDGLPLHQSSVIAALLELLRLHLPAGSGNEAHLPRRQVISAWCSPYFRWENGRSSITAADADNLDVFARQQRVIHGLAQWNAAFAVGILASDDDPKHAEAGGGQLLTGTVIRQLQEKFAHFLFLTQPPAAATTMREFVGWLETLIGPDPQAPGRNLPPPGSLQITAQARSNPDTEEGDVAALRTLKDILRGLVWAEEAVGQTQSVNFVSFFSELSGAISASSFTLPIRAEQPEILVANVLDVRGLSFHAAAVMGLSEGSFPATLNEDPFLRDMDRQQLRRQFNFQLESSTQSAEQEFFYEAVTRPRQKLLLTRPILADNGADWVASPFWEATQQLIAGAPELIPSEAVVPLAETASWPEWWETIASNPAGMVWANSQDSAAWQQIQTAAQIWQARLTTKPSVWDGELKTLSPELTMRYGPEYTWSASRLEAYQICGFLYFLQYVLKIAPRPEPTEGLDARQLGSLYHDIFEQVTAASDLEAADEEKVRDVVTATATPILDAAPEAQGFRETPWWANTRQEIMDNVTRSIIALAADAYKFSQAELSFGIHGPPLVIRDAQDKLQLRGFIDRVDRRENGQLRIIDYKLGGKYAFTPRAFAEGKKLQLPLYALAAQEALRLGTVVDGFYWHFQQAEASSFQMGKVDGGVTGAIDIAVAYAWEAVRRIRGGQFVPQPPEGGCPSYCPAAGFCWQYSPKSW